ncbi:MFS general substrate transporter [Meredithblackwellia eburnea MCA 4105]
MSSQLESQSEKATTGAFHEHVHHTAEQLKHGDAALQISEQVIEVTEEDSSRICRLTDKYILTLLIWVYFLQILDKSVIGYSATFGLKTNAHLVGNQGAIGYFAQLGAQPVGAFLLVKLKPRTVMPIITFCWGVSLLGMAASKTYSGLMATRFLLGLFEALCLPLFSLITVSWYRRSEQPIRVAAWYSTNGIATMVGSALSYGLGQIHSKHVYSYQLIFIVTGCLTVLTTPVIWWRLDNSVVEARFLSEQDRYKGVERLRANQTGVQTTEFKKEQILEFVLDPKTYLFLGMSIAINMGASVITVMGPLLLQGLVGFKPATSVLLNIPFGALQFLLIHLSSYLAVRFKTKSIIFFVFILPVIVGSSILFGLKRVAANKGPLLLGYCVNPLIIAWISSNTGGQSKKSAMITLFNAGSAAGNIVGPYLFKANTAPAYRPGMSAVVGFFAACEGLIVLNVLYLAYLNRHHEKMRVAEGKPAKIADLSMTRKFDNSKQEEGLGEQAFLDLTDKRNSEFVYVY